ncbi:MAG: hypothetical protein IKO30_02545 [Lachnospiraceae bacterium]|nr:hypothetical protein [Lachnospiraceae bacterium]
MRKTIKTSILISLTASAILASSGCNKSSTGTPDPDPSSGITLSNEQAPDQSDSSIDLSDKTIINWFTNNMITLSTDVVTAVNKRLDELGKPYAISFKHFPEESFEATVNEYISKKNAPDIISASIGLAGQLSGTYRAYKNSWLLDLSDYLHSEKGSILLNSVPESCWKASSVNGSYIGLSTLLPLNTHKAYYVNRDILDTLDLKAEDLSNLKLLDLSQYLSQIDDDSCCKLDVSGCVNYYDIDGIYPLVTIGSQVDAIVYDIDLEKAVNVFDSEKVMYWIKCITDYKNKGYIDDHEKTNFFISIGPYDCLSYTIQDDYIDSLKSKYPDAKNIIEIPYTETVIQTQYNSVTGICSSSNNLDMALDAFTTIMTDTALSDLLIYGINGKDYSLDISGNVIPDATAWAFPMYYGNSFIASRKASAPSDLAEQYEKLKTPKFLGIYMDLSMYSEKADIINSVTADYKGLISGEYDNYEEILHDALNKTADAGINEILNDINSQMTSEQE